MLATSDVLIVLIESVTYLTYRACRTGREHVQRAARNPAAMACSPLSLFAYLLAVVFSAFVIFEVCRPDLLLVGNVTIDVLDGKGTRYQAPGGECVRGLASIYLQFLRLTQSIS